MVLDFILEKLHQKIQLNKVLILSDSQSSIGILTLGWDPTQHKITAKDILTKMDLIKRRGIDIDILSFSIYCLVLAFEHYRQGYIVHSGSQDESLQVTISKLL